MRDLIAPGGGQSGSEAPLSYEIVTVETDRGLVQTAIMAALGDKLQLQRPISFTMVEDEDLTRDNFFVIQEDHQYLSDVLATDAKYDVKEFKGGVAIEVVLDDGEAPLTTTDFEKRLREIRLRPEYEHYQARKSRVLPLGTPVPLDDGQSGYRRFAYVAVDENLTYDDDDIQWTREVAEVELAQVEGALASEKSLSKVIQFEAQIAAQTQQNTIFAIVLALAAIVAYVWLRFGTMQYGLAAIVALVHDVCITLGMVTLSHFIYNTFIGRIFYLSDFKIDLPMIAAVLTVIGYSLNDTIVVFDRIRENRGKLGTLSAAVINNSINQTLSRTLLTSITTFLVVLVMFIWGGSGIKGFSYALLVGVVVGTYSSVGVATPLLYRPRLLNAVTMVIVALGIIGVIFGAIDHPVVRAVLSIITAVIFGVWLATSVIRSRAESGAGRAVARA